jgi:nitrogen PTS system EIIA component
MYLNLIQIAESFGVTEKAVEDWIRDEELPCVADRGRLLFDRAQVALWAAAHGLTARAGFLAPENGAFATGFALSPMLRAGGIWRGVKATGIVGVLEKVIAAMTAVPQPVRTLLGQRLRASGGINWAPVGGGFALPHFSTRVTLGRDAGLIALLLLQDSLTMAASPEDEMPVTKLFFFIPPSPRAHLDTLGRLNRAIAMGPLRALVERGAPDQELLQGLEHYEASRAAGQEHETKP